MSLSAFTKLVPLPLRIWIRSRLNRTNIRGTLSSERLAVLRHMEGIIQQRPLDIALETITVCNSRCVFCAYRKTKRGREVMPMGLYEKILDQYAEMGGGSMGFAPFLADPLLDPMLFDRLRAARAREKFLLHAFTNGIRFSKFSDEELLEFVSSMHILNISMGGLDQESYQKMFGVDRFNDIWRNLERIARLVREHRLKTRIYIHFRTFERSRVEGHPRYEQLRKMGFAHISIMTDFNNWGGLVTQDDLPKGATLLSVVNRSPTGCCVIPVTEMSILPDGAVLACGCYDGEMQHIMGNANEDSLSAIWRGEAYATFRRHFKGPELHPLCRNCGCYASYERLLSSKRLTGYDASGEVFWSKISR